MKNLEKLLTAIFIVGMLLSGVFFAQTDWRFAQKRTKNPYEVSAPGHTTPSISKKDLDAHFLEYQNALSTFKTDMEKQNGEVNESCKKAVALAESMIADMKKDAEDNKSAAKYGFLALILLSALVLFLKWKTKKAPEVHKDGWELGTTVTEMLAAVIIYAITAKLLF
ncbi:MAG: hypothetical protein K2X81_09740 [Candidatus Obscuribacterales bacterium]|nr:hypothetical protein [Candidatus Obscuribacterales bacterium]